MKKKLLAILLCFAMIAGMLPVTVFAAGVYEIRYKGTKNYEAGAVASSPCQRAMLRPIE